MIFISHNIKNLLREKGEGKNKVRKPNLVETLHNTVLIRFTHSQPLGTHLTQSKHTFHNTQLGSRGIKTRNSQPVIHDHTSADDGATAVHTTGDEWHLEQGGEFVLVTDGGLGVNDTTLVGEGHVGACKDVVGDGLAEDFDAEDVGNTRVGFWLAFSFFLSLSKRGRTFLPSHAPNPDAPEQHDHCSK